MLIFRLLIALAFLFAGIYWLYDLWPFSWGEFVKSFSYDKAASQKSQYYSGFFALFFIIYGVYEIKNVFQRNK